MISKQRPNLNNNNNLLFLLLNRPLCNKNAFVTFLVLSHTVPKIIRYLRIRTERVSAGVDATCQAFVHMLVYLTQKPDIYRCICPNCKTLFCHVKI